MCSLSHNTAKRQPAAWIPLRAIRRLVDCLEPDARRNYESVRDTEDTARHLYHSVHAVSSWLDKTEERWT
jgi:hypothetical protein